MSKPRTLSVLATLVMLALAIGLASVQPARAQTADPQQTDIQQMQKKLEQQEMENQQMQKKLEEQQVDNQQMQKKLENMDQEIHELKGQMAEQPKGEAGPNVLAGGREAPPSPVEKPEKPPAANTVDFYGFVMLDSGYNFGTINPDWFDVDRVTQLPSFPGQFAPDGNTFFGTRQTRFGVKSSTQTPLGELKTIFEFDLFGVGADAGQTTFRLRQAYGELGHFGAGQTMSAFMDIDVFPNELDYWGPTGMVFFRNVQFRWMPIKGPSHIIIALERPGASADGGVYADRIEVAGVRPQFQYPDLTGNARLARKWGYIQVGGIYRRIAWVDTNATSALDLSGAANGWGVSVSSNLNFSKNNVGKFQVVYGKAIENYMNDAPIDIGIRNNFSNPVTPIQGVPLPVLGVVSFLDHTWSKKFTTSIGYSLENIDNADADAPTAFHQGQYAIGNLLYSPISKVTLGTEFQFGRRQSFSNGYSYNDYKVQFSYKYDWSKGFSF